MGNVNVVCAEMLPAKYFSEHEGEQPADVCLGWVKDKMRGSGVRRREIKTARQNLGIDSQKTELGYMWTWKSDTDPATMWAIKSKEFLEC